LSVAVCIHKCIRNGYIDNVMCTFTQAVLMLLDTFSLDLKSINYERNVNIALSYMARTRKTKKIILAE